jgi:D-alanyl-D-alanine endopeptidase (penicillin-binding protein 7)
MCLIALGLVLGLPGPAEASASRERAAAPKAKSTPAAKKATPEARRAPQAKRGPQAKRASEPTARGAKASTRQASSARAGQRADRRAPARASQRAGQRSVARAKPPVAAPVRLSVGQRAGLHATDDPLDLSSSVALVVDQQSGDVLLSKNPDAVLPIASITKLMTALIVAETGQPLDEVLTITAADIDTEKGSRSRLPVGTRLTRGEMLHLSLMSSENRAANALGRHYPGGLRAFVSAMNAKAQLLGMSDTEYAEPTGLSSRNRSSARDLALLVEAAYRHDVIRDLSTSTGMRVETGARPIAFHNTNRLVHSPAWEIGLQKTGFISEAGRCLVMQAEVAGRAVIMVFLDSVGRHARLGDAERVRQWVSSTLAPAAAMAGETDRAAGVESLLPDAGDAIEAAAGVADALARSALQGPAAAL